jgi:hypothetical protein
MYDRGIVSVGLFQWIEAGYGNVSSLLSLVCAAGLEDHVQQCLSRALQATGTKFVKNVTKWQFVQNGRVVDNLDAQKKLFLGCEGTTGMWTPELRGHAILWAECIASVWDDPRAREVQRKFANDRVMQYVFKTSKAVLFKADAPKTPMANAVRTIYVALAVNAPGTADNILLETMRTCRAPEWSDEWCLAVLKALATTPLLPNFAKRYMKARAVAEIAFGVKLPESFSDVIVHKVMAVSAPGPQGNPKTRRSQPPAYKIIQLEPTDIVVPPLKPPTLFAKLVNVFKK